MTTKREQVWVAALVNIHNHGQVKTRDIDLDGISKQTVAKALKSMENAGLIERESEQAQTYYPSQFLAEIAASVTLQYIKMG